GGSARTPGAAAAVRVLHRPAERVRSAGYLHADGHVRARAADRHPRRGALRTGTDAPRSGGRHRAGAALGTDRSGDLVQRADAGGGARVDLAARGGSAMTTVSMSVQDALWLTMDRPNNLMVVDGSMVLRGVPSIDDVTAVLQEAVE